MVATAVPIIVPTIVSQDMAGIGVKARFADASFTNTSPRYLSYNQLTESFAGGVLATRRIGGRLFAQVEAAATSLLPYCDKFDEANWNTNELTPADEAETTPHADFDGWSLTPTAVSDVHTLYDPYNVNGSSQYVWSGVFKANGYNFVMLRLGTAGFAGSPFAYFNLSTGAAGNSSGVDTVGIEDMGGDWYRCYASAASDAAADGEPLIAVCDQDYNLYTPTSFSGDTSSGVLCCHTQFGVGYFPTSIIETAAAAVTRNTDQLYWASASVPNALRGKISIDVIPYWSSDVADPRNIISWATSGASHAVRLYYYHTTDKYRAYDVTGTATLVESDAVTFSLGQKHTLTYDPVAGTLKVSGCTTGDGTNTGTPYVTTAGNVYVGANHVGTPDYNGLISEPY